MTAPLPAPIVVLDLDETIARHVPAAVARRAAAAGSPAGPPFPATPEALRDAVDGSFAPPPGRFFTVPASRAFGGAGGHFALRPGLLPLLVALRRAGAQVVVWTHGSRAYAEPVVAALAPHVPLPLAIYCDAAVSSPGAAAARPPPRSAAAAPAPFHRTVAAARGPAAPSGRAAPKPGPGPRGPRPTVVTRRGSSAAGGPKPTEEVLARLARTAPPTHGARCAPASAHVPDGRSSGGAAAAPRRGPPHRIVLVENSASNIAAADRPCSLVVPDFLASAAEAADPALPALLAVLRDTVLAHTAGGPAGPPLRDHPAVMTLPSSAVQYLRV